MKNQRLKAVALSTVLSVGALMGSVASADQTLEAVLQVGQAKTTLAQDSQKRIDRLAQETSDLTQEFKTQNRVIADLRLYNSQMERQIAAQLKVVQDLDESIEQVTVIERSIQPLISRMLDSLEQFIRLDKPFRLEERLARIDMLRNNQDRADISVSEKFRQVLEAYKIEGDAGRFVDTYQTSLPINNQDRQVNILQIGRVSLVYQTTDTQLAGAWDAAQNAWVPLDNSYRSAILKGFRMARKLDSLDMFSVPVQAPEAAK